MIQYNPKQSIRYIYIHTATQIAHSVYFYIQINEISLFLAIVIIRQYKDAYFTIVSKFYECIAVYCDVRN